MTCMEAQALITPFINDKLNMIELEQFLDHVEECNECMEELKVYFALLTAIRQLDEKEEVSSDFDKELSRKLKESQEKILHAKIVHIRKRIVYFAMVVIFGLLTSVSVVVEVALNEEKETKYNRVVIENEVLAPYMDSVLLNHMITYQQLQDEIDRQQEEKELQEALEQEAEKKREEEKQKKQQMISAENAKEALNEAYSEYNSFSKEYENASDYVKLRYDKWKAEQNGRDIPDTPMEYSR